MKIQALGGCCKNSTLNYENAVKAAKLCNIENEVENIKDMKDILKLGVMKTPGLVINGKVVSSGRVLSVDKIVELINKNK